MQVVLKSGYSRHRFLMEVFKCKKKVEVLKCQISFSLMQM